MKALSPDLASGDGVAAGALTELSTTTPAADMTRARPVCTPQAGLPVCFSFEDVDYKVTDGSQNGNNGTG